MKFSRSLTIMLVDAITASATSERTLWTTTTAFSDVGIAQQFETAQVALHARGIYARQMFDGWSHSRAHGCGGRVCGYSDIAHISKDGLRDQSEVSKLSRLLQWSYNVRARSGVMNIKFYPSYINAWHDGMASIYRGFQWQTAETVN